MPSSHFTLHKADPSDAGAWADCFFDGFCQGPVEQVPFYATMFPKTPDARAFFADSFAKQMESEPAHFVHVVDGNAGDKIVGFAKWAPPGSAEAYWADYGHSMNEGVCDEFFGAMAEHREKLMGDRPHWYLEIMGVSLAYQRQGVGKMLMKYGCDLIDSTDGKEAYVDSSPIAKGLYGQFGFQSRAHKMFDEPFDWYREEFMVRPAKGT